LSVNAQAADRSLREVIDGYVTDGLNYNLALRNESLAVEQAQAALRSARAQFMPDVGLAARYSRANGGRTIAIPVSELLNPVYSTLNEMLAAQGRPAQFPQLQDQTIDLIREHEQDTRLTARQPLYAPALSAGIRVQSALLSASEARRMAIARELKRDISVAYLNWLRASQTVQIVSSSEALLVENLRVNQSLYSNGRVTEDQPLRARAELLAVQQQLQDARNATTQTRSYVNFLINRQLDMELESSTAPETPLQLDVADLAELRAAATDNRPELAQLAQTLIAAQQQVAVALAATQPTLWLSMDTGIQGDNYGLGATTISVQRRCCSPGSSTSRRRARASLRSARRRQARCELAGQCRQADRTAGSANTGSLSNLTLVIRHAQARSQAAQAASR